MATFVSKQVRFRVYLTDNPTGAGGLWADFGEEGQYETKNREYIDILMANPLFNIEFFRVADKKVTYGCPQCDYNNPNPRAVLAHAVRVHKARYTTEDLVEKNIKVEVANGSTKKN